LATISWEPALQPADLSLQFLDLFRDAARVARLGGVSGRGHRPLGLKGVRSIGRPVGPRR
jgi:hypothetical protein